MFGTGMFFDDELLKKFFGDFVVDNPSVDEQKCELVKTEEKSSTVSQNNEIWGSDEDHYFLNVGIPCPNPELDVEVTNGCVNIKYKSETVNEGEGFTHSYTSAGCMTYSIPEGANKSTLKAKKKDGYLFLTVEKSKPTNHSFKVEIE
jgi:HSP20 family molecular chaperone IbpA